GGVAGNGHPETLFGQIAAQEVPDTGVVIHDQKMGGIIGKNVRHRSNSLSIDAICGSRPRMSRRNASTEERPSGGSVSSARLMRRDCGSDRASANSRPASVG